MGIVSAAVAGSLGGGLVMGTWGIVRDLADLQEMENISSIDLVIIGGCAGGVGGYIGYTMKEMTESESCTITFEQTI